MQNELIVDEEPTYETPAVARHVDSVAAMLQSAIDRGVTPESLTTLVELHERVMAKQAEREFNGALLAFQAECPIINKNKTADTGKYTYDYADLSHLVASIRPLLTKHGLSFSFDSGISEGKVSVTCIVAHIGGHKVPTKFIAPTDAKSAMNDTQKVASAVSYCQRYALRLALGLTVGEDDDGRRAHANPQQRPDSPRVQPRGNRGRPHPNQAVVDEIYTAWAGGLGSALSEQQRPKAFYSWVSKTLERNSYPQSAQDWTDAEFKTCCDALQMNVPPKGEA